MTSPLKIQKYDPTYSTGCPHCGTTIRFYALSGMGDVAPHFYCNRCSNVFFRETDRELIRGVEPTPELLARIAATLPHCPCGGTFRPGENPKCPHCTRPVEHQSGPVDRLFDPRAIVVEGAALVQE